MYFNAETHQMEWLAYTATFMSKKPSDKFNIIKYGKWNNVNGLILPSEITWYKKDENGVLSSTSKIVEFTLPLISQGQLDNSFYEKPIN